MLTADMLRRLWPDATEAKRAAVVAVAPDVFRQFGLNTPLRVAHYMAQVSHECGGGTIVRENMNYRAARIMTIFGVGRHSAAVTEGEAEQLAHNPRELAERVYGLGNPKKAKALGNINPGDGWRYRGGGDLQLTGRADYARYSKLVGIDLVANPDRIAEPAVAFRTAAAEFVALKCLPAADADDIELVTKRVNGGLNGLADRTVWLRKWKEVLQGFPEDLPPGDNEPINPPRAAELDPAPSAVQSPTVQATTVGGGLGIGAIAYQAWDVIRDAPAGLIDAATKLSQRPGFWWAVAVLAVFAFVFRQKLKKIFREGL